jgi:hypothetical protein
MLGQPIGDPAMQPLKFGPAHLHRDVVVAKRGVGDEIQLDGVPMENRVAADRLVDQSLSHVLWIQCPMIERDVTNHARTDNETKAAASDDELNYV